MNPEGAANSESASSDDRPQLPRTPLERFADQVILLDTQNVGNSQLGIRARHLEKIWDELDAEARQHWEAQYGRDMLEYQKRLERWERHHAHLRGRSDSRSIKRRGKRLPTSASLSRSPTPTSTPPATSFKILFRAELYQLKISWDAHGRNRRKLRPLLLDAVEHDSQMIVTTQKSLLNPGAAIFEVTTFLAAPGQPINDPNNQYDDDYQFRGYLTYRDGQPIVARAEAGMILTINSEIIIEALHAVTSGYPDLAFEGDALVVPEPFCVLLQNREEMLKHRASLKARESPTMTIVADRTVELPDVTEADPVGETKTNPSGLARAALSTADHITELYKFLDQKYLEAMDTERARWKQAEPVCTFEWAWLLFSPGTLVYEQSNTVGELPRAFLVESFSLHGLFHYGRNSKKPKVKASRLETSRALKFRHRLSRIKIFLTFLKHDGRRWIAGKKKVNIAPFNGERLITNLPICPADYFVDPDGALRERLVARGRRYHTLASRGQFEYHGETLSGTRRWLHSRIIVDSETFHYDPRLLRRDLVDERIVVGDRSPERVVYVSGYDSSSDDSESQRRSRRYRRNRRNELGKDEEPPSDSDPEWDTKATNVMGRRHPAHFLENIPLRQQPLWQALRGPSSTDGNVSSEIYLICDREVNAYVLEERDWVLLDVEHIRDCNFDEHMIDDLQVRDETKRLIQALAQTYTLRGSAPREDEQIAANSPFPAPWSSDFVPNKGQGQLILLHGKPGVGKTTAAECVAELTKRPLLSVTCGDLGTSTTAVQKELTRWLRLGTLWNGILLFDEADIFLEARARGDIKRNSLVSIFLRALEYYQGLMFLTTNRVGTFDEAVISRVHVILHFPDLTDDDRVRIWDTSFRKLSSERPNFKVDFSIYDYAYRDDRIKGLSWNGREIRNAFNTMIALAEWDARNSNRFTKDHKIEVRREHLQQVVNMSNGFKDYMKSLRGFDEADHAKFQGLRDDTFPPSK